MAASEVPGLSITEWVVLGLLAEAPAHGFALARELSRDTTLGQVWTVPRALVYRAIGEPLAPLVAEQRAEFAPLFDRLAGQHRSGEAEPVVAAWRYESSLAVARLLDSLEALDTAPEPASNR